MFEHEESHDTQTAKPHVATRVHHRSQALGAVDNLERRLQQQMAETEQLQEQHRRQLEAAEYELPGINRCWWFLKP